MAKSVVDAPMIRGNYEIIEHTADIGIRVRGRTLEEVFALAAGSMFDLMIDVSQVQPVEKAEISLEAESLEELFVTWLNELVFRAEVSEMFFSRFEVDSVTEKSLRASAMGEPYKENAHSSRVQVKAATYHQLEICPSDEGWFANVIFDV